jgi:hypothetical protein
MKNAVWVGRYIEKDGVQLSATILVDGDALAKYFGRSAHSRNVFRKAREEGSGTAKRLNGSVILKLTAMEIEEV